MENCKFKDYLSIYIINIFQLVKTIDINEPIDSITGKDYSFKFYVMIREPQAIVHKTKNTTENE
jgi:hypothetical protein